MEAQKLDRRILVEEAVKGREIECAVLGNENDVELQCQEKSYHPRILRLRGQIYKWKKCNFNTSRSEDKRNEVMELAKKAYKSLDCSVFPGWISFI